MMMTSLGTRASACAYHHRQPYYVLLAYILVQNHAQNPVVGSFDREDSSNTHARWHPCPGEFRPVPSSSVERVTIIITRSRSLPFGEDLCASVRSAPTSLSRPRPLSTVLIYAGRSVAAHVGKLGLWSARGRRSGSGSVCARRAPSDESQAGSRGEKGTRDVRREYRGRKELETKSERVVLM